jgi:Fibronectin type III domain
MTRVMAFGGVRFVLAGALAFALAACFVGRAEAASVFSSSFAAPAVFANSAAPGARVVAGDRALTLSWSAVKGAAGYRVSWRGRVLKGGKPTAAWSAKWLGLKVLKASARSYKATGLVNGDQYQLRLESNTKAKKSRWVVRSTPVASPKAVTPAPTPAVAPGAPTNVTGVAGDGQVVVSWLAPSSDGGSAITAYIVTALGVGNSAGCYTTGALSCSVAGLRNGSPYTFTVVATNARGTSVASVASAAATPATVPGAPTGVSGVAGDGQVVVSWLAPSSDGGSAVTGYTVTASGGGSQTCTTSGALSCSVTGLARGTAYTFTVVATNARGNSVASRASDAFTAGSWVVGDTGPGGGKVFYVLGGSETVSGAACGSSCRYLEAAPAGWTAGGDPDREFKWGGGNGTAGQCSNKTISGADGTDIGSGFANTAAIMLACPSTDEQDPQSAPAALAASTYAPTVGGAVVTGWFLPSKDELNALDVSSLGGLSNDYYWSSSQYSVLYPWTQHVGNCTPTCRQFSFVDKKEPDRVRAVRAF